MEEDVFNGVVIQYPDNVDCKCSVIEHDGSYGRTVDKLEIMGLLTIEEKSRSSVLGYLTAKDVFDRIMKDYKGD